MLVTNFLDTIMLVKNFSLRTRTLMMVGLTLLILILLAASINTVPMHNGRAVPENYETPNLFDMEVSSEWGQSLMAAFRVVIVAAWVLAPLYIIYLILSKEARKRFLRDMMAFLPVIAFLLLILSISRNRGGSGEGLEILMPTGDVPTTEGTPIPPLPEYLPPPAWVTTAVTVVLALMITAIIVGVTLALMRRARNRQTEPIRLVEREAQAALDSIQAGGDLRDAILRAYAQMVEAAHQYRNIRRDQDMTPHEFEQLLTHRGLPSAPIHDLTELFEQVRYGGQTPGRQQERVAVASLSAIVTACKKYRGNQ